MKTQEVARQITPGKKIYTFSKDEVKEILLKAALKELNQSEPPLSEYEMRLRVTLPLMYMRLVNITNGRWLSAY